jgi:prepilin-type N-terminal cleavage/methylation domain-containing protein
MILTERPLYMIFKVLTQISTKQHDSNKGFTLLELLAGLVIMSIVCGLSLQAFVQSSTDFNKDKKTIDSNQNLSAVLEMIGNDIKVAGEQINDGNFPAIEFKRVTTATDPTLVDGSSKIIIRRAVSTPLTLCQTTAISTATTSITVADNNAGVVGASPNCDIGTLTNPFFMGRTGNFSATPTPAAGTFNGASGPILPVALRQARDYRCTLDQPNLVLDINTDACIAASATTTQRARMAISDQNGHMLMFNQTGETVLSATAPTFRYGITVNSSFGTGDSAIANNAPGNQPAISPYGVGNPIYLIEERVYTLVKDPNNVNSGILNLAVNGGSPSPLLKGLNSFNISGRLYTDSITKVINPTPALPTVTIPATTISAANFVCPTSNPNYPTQPSTGTSTDPQYICQFNYKTQATDVAMDWKNIAGIRVRLQAVYDSRGQASETSTNPSDVAFVAAEKRKLTAMAEYFPRNVLSK